MKQTTKNPNHYFNILIVDDIRDIHPITKNAFFDEEIEGKELNFLSAYDEDEAISILNKNHKSLSVVLLDITMKSKDGGLMVIQHLRNNLKNNVTQIVIRTAEFADFPMRNIIDNYRIHDYIEKGQTEEEQLYVSIKSAIRTYVALDNNEKSIFDLEHKVEERTREIKQLFNVSTPLIQIDRKHKIISANNSFKKLFNLKGSITDKTCYEVLDCKKKGKKDCSLVKLTNGKSQDSYLSSKMINDRDKLHYRVNAIPIKDENQKTLSIVENVNDITEIHNQKIELEEHRNNLEMMIQDRTASLNSTKNKLEDANKELLVLDDAKTEFLNIISHEIRTPLNAIVNNANFLQEELEKFSKNNSESVDRLTDLSITALNFTHIKARGKEMKRTRVNIENTVSKIKGKYQSAADKKNLTITTSFCYIKHLVCVQAYLEQSVDELLSNAIKYSFEDSEIKISTISKRNKLIFAISNRGEKIEKERLERIKKPFGLGKEHYDKHIGLGICYIRAFLELHDAELEISSNDKITEFRLVFSTN